MRFVEQARLARRRGLRVVIFKAGRTALGAQAAASHTASLAGDYAVARACLEDAGVTVAESLDEFEDLIRTFTLLNGRPAAGQRVGIMSNAGFECSTVTDELGGLELARLDDAACAVLDGALPGFAHRLNPVDATPMADSKAFTDCCAAILACPDGGRRSVFGRAGHRRHGHLAGRPGRFSPGRHCRSGQLGLASAAGACGFR